MRQVELKRQTYETAIAITLALDGQGEVDIETGIGFFDHMLTHIGKHSGMNMVVKAKGDIIIDPHHTVEDVGIVLGKALSQALGDKKRIVRYGDCIVPMDEALILCALDLSGRAYLDIETPFTSERVGAFDTQLVEEFFRAVAFNAGMNLHLQVLRGRNDHHIIEGMCKAFARALKQAIYQDPRCTGIPSTKGVLEVGV